MTHSNEHLKVKMYGLKGLLCDSLDHSTASMRFLKFDFCFAFFVCFLFLLLNLGFFFGGGVEVRGQGDEWNQDA